MKIKAMGGHAGDHGRPRENERPKEATGGYGRIRVTEFSPASQIYASDITARPPKATFVWGTTPIEPITLR